MSHPVTTPVDNRDTAGKLEVLSRGHVPGGRRGTRSVYLVDMARVVDPALAGLTAQAIADLVARLGLVEDEPEVRVASAEIVTWPDTGLGCRRPGMRYPQVPVDGCRIVLEHGGRRYAYHAGGRVRVPFLCERPG